MEVGENRVRVFYGTEKREGERLEMYTEGISPCSRTVYQTCNIMYICNTEYPGIPRVTAHDRFIRPSTYSNAFGCVTKPRLRLRFTKCIGVVLVYAPDYRKI